MRVNVGSKNPLKVQAVNEVFSKYFPHKDINVVGYDVSSGVSAQPKGFNEIFSGAKNRAFISFNDCDYSIGLESGLIHRPFSEFRYYDLCTCAIFDGTHFVFGNSGSFELPIKITKRISDSHIELSDAAVEEGFTNSEEKLGYNEGIIGILTGGILKRKDQIAQAIEMAMPMIINPHYYEISKDF